MNFDPGLEQLRGDQATFESAQELSHIFSYNLRPKKLFLVWVDFPALCLKVANCDRYLCLLPEVEYLLLTKLDIKISIMCAFYMLYSL